MIKNQEINIFKNLKIDNSENYKSNLLECVKQMKEFTNLKEGYIFLDVGTNLSWVTDKLLTFKEKGQIHCFEPHFMFFKMLKEKHENNKNVFLNEVAVSNRNGESYLYFKNGKNKNNGGASLNSKKINICGKYKTLVKTIKLSDYISKFEKIDVLKMDVEGVEYDILEELIESGAIHKIKYIFYECHLPKIPSLKEKKNEILMKLTELGIKTYYW